MLTDSVRVNSIDCQKTCANDHTYLKEDDYQPGFTADSAIRRNQKPNMTHKVASMLRMPVTPPKKRAKKRVAQSAVCWADVEREIDRRLTERMNVITLLYIRCF